MTDIYVPADNALVDRAAFNKESIWLPHLAAHHFKAGKPGIENKIFTDCVVEGPAVLMVLGGVMFEDCNLGRTEDADNLLLKPVGEKVGGVIPIRNCKFVRCEFVRVAYTGNAQFLAEFARGIKPMSEIADEGSAS